MRRLMSGMLAALVLTTIGCASMERERLTKPSLYDRLGGRPAITAVVDDFVGKVAADGRINQRFAGANIPRLKGMLVDQICHASGGPCQYTGKSMSDAHRGMAITDAEFGALVDDLVKSARRSTRPGTGRVLHELSLDRLKVPGPEKQELLTALGGMKPQIVGQ